ncbi:PAS domain-containing hybrid sensor histidine kinase/response regulator [Nostoc sp. UHCC 0870]|uniref:PAS domain-containing hybrid sensor histidine kinase/response regulator n=1 Tax=Nostoc sp. UHCC 0870 TaxID=2914041 RepID=UPI001EDFC210|nr:PAS domain-containing sensor histidine kinase [Nostoc sp. UHCC 0870]UKO97970.1 PAS domain S-box protein [Nostoc sp. UHCC 0870]
MTPDNWTKAIDAANQRLDILLQRASQPQDMSRWQDAPVVMLTEAIAEISISLEELNVLAEELQLQNQELIATRQQVEAERQRYQDLFNFAPDAYLVTDITGIIQEANHIAAQLLQVRQSYLIGKPMSVFVHPDARANFRQLILDLQQQGHIRNAELRIFYKEGETDFPAELTAVTERNRTGKVTSLRWLFRNISDRQRTAQKLREQAALLDITTDAILVKDLHSQILFWNKGAENLYGWTATEALGKSGDTLLFTNNSPQLQQAKKTVLETGAWQGELHKVDKNGKKIIIASRWTLMYDAADLPKSILCVDTDITEKKQLEAQLLRIQRLESLGTLTSGIAHDLNNILTPILTVAQLLPIKHPQLEEDSQQMLELLATSAKRGADLVHQISTFGRNSENNSINLQIATIISDIEQIIKRTFPKSIEIKTDIATDLASVLGDSTQLHQVLMNLVINARDAIPDSGELSISADNLFIDEDFAKQHIGAEVGCYVVIKVADTGIGIHPDNLDKIFDPFFTTKAIGKGTGLGLSTVIGIVNNHNGFVTVSSQLGIGSEFQIYIPSNDSPISLLKFNQILPTGNGELILVVDDELAIIQITKTVLESHNYKVLTAENGIEALSLYNQYQDEIQLVLIDMMMPIMAGDMAISTLQIINPQIKIIAMSGLETMKTLIEFSQAGVKKFLPKPFTHQELLRQIHELISLNT